MDPSKLRLVRSGSPQPGPSRAVVPATVTVKKVASPKLGQWALNKNQLKKLGIETSVLSALAKLKATKSNDTQARPPEPTASRSIVDQINTPQSQNTTTNPATPINPTELQKRINTNFEAAVGRRKPQVEIISNVQITSSKTPDTKRITESPSASPQTSPSAETIRVKKLLNAKINAKMAKRARESDPSPERAFGSVVVKKEIDDTDTIQNATIATTQLKPPQDESNDIKMNFGQYFTKHAPLVPIRRRTKNDIESGVMVVSPTQSAPIDIDDCDKITTKRRARAKINRSASPIMFGFKVEDANQSYLALQEFSDYQSDMEQSASKEDNSNIPTTKRTVNTINLKPPIGVAKRAVVNEVDSEEADDEISDVETKRRLLSIQSPPTTYFQITHDNAVDKSVSNDLREAQTSGRFRRTKPVPVAVLNRRPAVTPKSNPISKHATQRPVPQRSLVHGLRMGANLVASPLNSTSNTDTEVATSSLSPLHNKGLDRVSSLSRNYTTTDDDSETTLTPRPTRPKRMIRNRPIQVSLPDKSDDMSESVVDYIVEGLEDRCSSLIQMAGHFFAAVPKAENSKNNSNKDTTTSCSATPANKTHTMENSNQPSTSAKNDNPCVRSAIIGETSKSTAEPKSPTKEQHTQPYKSSVYSTLPTSSSIPNLANVPGTVTVSKKKLSTSERAALCNTLKTIKPGILKLLKNASKSLAAKPKEAKHEVARSFEVVSNLKKADDVVAPIQSSTLPNQLTVDMSNTEKPDNVQSPDNLIEHGKAYTEVTIPNAMSEGRSYQPTIQRYQETANISIDIDATICETNMIIEDDPTKRLTDLPDLPSYYVLLDDSLDDENPNASYGKDSTQFGFENLLTIKEEPSNEMENEYESTDANLLEDSQLRPIILTPNMSTVSDIEPILILDTDPNTHCDFEQTSFNTLPSDGKTSSSQVSPEVKLSNVSDIGFETDIHTYCHAVQVCSSRLEESSATSFGIDTIYDKHVSGRNPNEPLTIETDRLSEANTNDSKYQEDSKLSPDFEGFPDQSSSSNDNNTTSDLYTFSVPDNVEKKRTIKKSSSKPSPTNPRMSKGPSLVSYLAEHVDRSKLEKSIIEFNRSLFIDLTDDSSAEDSSCASPGCSEMEEPEIESDSDIEQENKAFVMEDLFHSTCKSTDEETIKTNQRNSKSDSDCNKVPFPMWEDEENALNFTKNAETPVETSNTIEINEKPNEYKESDQFDTPEHEEVFTERAQEDIDNTATNHAIDKSESANLMSNCNFIIKIETQDEKSNLIEKQEKPAEYMESERFYPPEHEEEFTEGAQEDSDNNVAVDKSESADQISNCNFTKHVEPTEEKSNLIEINEKPSEYKESDRFDPPEHEEEFTEGTKEESENTATNVAVVKSESATNHINTESSTEQEGRLNVHSNRTNDEPCVTIKSTEKPSSKFPIPITRNMRHYKQIESNRSVSVNIPKQKQNTMINHKQSTQIKSNQSKSTDPSDKLTERIQGQETSTNIDSNSFLEPNPINSNPTSKENHIESSLNNPKDIELALSATENTTSRRKNASSIEISPSDWNRCPKKRRKNVASYDNTVISRIESVESNFSRAEQIEKTSDPFIGISCEGSKHMEHDGQASEHQRKRNKNKINKSNSKKPLESKKRSQPLTTSEEPTPDPKNNKVDTDSGVMGPCLHTEENDTGNAGRKSHVESNANCNTIVPTMEVSTDASEQLLENTLLSESHPIETSTPIAPRKRGRPRKEPASAHTKAKSHEKFDSSAVSSLDHSAFASPNVSDNEKCNSLSLLKKSARKLSSNLPLKKRGKRIDSSPEPETPPRTRSGRNKTLSDSRKSYVEQSSDDDNEPLLKIKRKMKSTSPSPDIQFRRPGRPRKSGDNNLKVTDLIKTEAKSAPLPALVTCGNCKEQVVGLKWQAHLISHYGAAWIEGLEPPMALDNMQLTGNRMSFFAKRYKIKVFVCKKCGAEKKSGIGFLSHVEMCGLTEDQREAMFYRCPHCPAKIRTVSRFSHDQICPGIVRKDISKKIESEEEHSETESLNESGRSQRKSAKKAKRSLRELTKLEEPSPFSGSESDAFVGDVSTDSEGSSGVNEDEIDHQSKSLNPTKRYKRTKLTLTASTGPEKDMMDVYKKHLILSLSDENLSIPAMEMTRTFQAANYTSSPLFKFVQPTSCTTIDPVLAAQYVPISGKSPEFIDATVESYENNFGTRTINRWTTIERFQSIDSAKSHTLFCGGPVRVLEWIPLPKNVQQQFLAIFCQNDRSEIPYVSISTPSKGLLQIWSNHSLINDKAELTTPMQMQYNLTLDQGLIRCMAFCPSGGFDEANGRLGIAAIPTVQGDVHLFGLPLPDGNRGPALGSTVQLNPSLVLKGCLRSGQISRICWSKSKGHTLIVAGYKSGMVVLWNLNAVDNPVFESTVNGVRTLSFMNVLQACTSVITQLDLHHDQDGNDRWLSTASTTKRVKLFDLHRLPMEVSIHSLKSRCTAGVWPTNWAVFFTTIDESYCLGLSSINVINPIGVGGRWSVFSTASGTLMDVGFNDWMNSYLTVSDIGEVRLGVCTQLLNNIKEGHKRFRTVLSFTDLANHTRDETDCNDVNASSDQKGIVFCDIDRPARSSKSTTFNKRRTHMDQLPMVRINRVAINPNENSHRWYATGHDTGFVRVCRIQMFR